MQRSNPKVDKFYHSKAWKDTSEAYMSSKYYICERCDNSATICHHKEYITINNVDNPDITLNWDNLEALCIKCHNKEHFKKDDEYYFDDEGNIVIKT